MASDHLDKLIKFSCSVYEWHLRSTEGKPLVDLSFYEKLKNFRCRIGIVGSQSVGKSTLLDALLGFPYLPTANVATTNCVTSICFGTEPELTVVSPDGAQMYPVALMDMPRALFAGLKCYAAEYLIKVYGLNSLDGFTDAYDLDDNGWPDLDDTMLHMRYDNIRHRQALVLHLLQTYVDQNALQGERPGIVKAVNKERNMLLSCLGIPLDLADYEIRLKVNSPLLKDGLVLVDLPGSGAVVSAGNGNSSQDELMETGMKSCDALMVVLEPSMTRGTVSSLDAALETLGEKASEAMETALIPVLNKMDVPGSAGCQSKIDAAFSQRNLDFSYQNGLIRVSAVKAEKRLYDGNPEMSVLRSVSGQAYLSIKPPDEAADCVSSEELVWHMLERAYQSSGFDRLLYSLSGYTSRAKEAACLRLLKELDRSYIGYLDESIRQLELLEAQLKNNEALVREFLDMIRDLVEGNISKQCKAFFNVYPEQMEQALRQALYTRYPEMEAALWARIRSLEEYYAYMSPERILLENQRKNLFEEVFRGMIGGFGDIYQKLEEESNHAWEKLKKDLRSADYFLCQDLDRFMEETQSSGAYSEKFSVAVRDTCKDLMHLSDSLQSELRTVIQRYGASGEEFVHMSLGRLEHVFDRFSGEMRRRSLRRFLFSMDYTSDFDSVFRRIIHNDPPDMFRDKYVDQCIRPRMKQMHSVHCDMMETVAVLRERVQARFEREQRSLETEIRQLRDVLSRLDPEAIPEQDFPSPEAEKILKGLGAVCARAADALGAI